MQSIISTESKNQIINNKVSTGLTKKSLTNNTKIRDIDLSITLESSDKILEEAGRKDLIDHNLNDHVLRTLQRANLMKKQFNK